MLNYHDFIVFILGIFATAFGSFLNYYFHKKETDAKDQRVKAAIKLLFIECIRDYINYLPVEFALSSWPKWNNSFWNTHQVLLAEYFPEECVTFSHLLIDVSSDSPSYLYPQINDSRHKAYKLLEKLESEY